MKLLLALLLALPIFAAEVVCEPPGNSRTPCSPPATYQLHSAAAHPFDAPVRFGGPIVIQGRTFWQWIKDGPASAPCTPAMLAEVRGSYAYGCAAKVGDVLYITSAFRATP